jgi:imidazolonepropionase-like amidohydrolase
MIKHGLARVGQVIGNMRAGTLSDYQYEREQPATWTLARNSSWIIKNVQIVDVDRGELFREKAMLVDGTVFGRLLNRQEAQELAQAPDTLKVVDGGNRYLVPGMSDIHCHLTLVSNYKFKLSALRYFDAQRRKNCEFALRKGCTTVRDSGGAYDMVRGLKDEIDTNRLLGPRILPSYTMMTPPGGMLDINPVMNRLAEVIFGGRLITYANDDTGIRNQIDEVVGWGAHSIKIYLEEKPIFGGRKDTVYNMFSEDQVEYIRDLADRHGKIVESHAMFIHGARMAILAGLNSVAHLTVDEPYSRDDAEMMVRQNVAIVPTFSVGSYLAMHCGENGFPDHPEYQFLRSMLQRYVKPTLKAVTIPQMYDAYLELYDFIWNERKGRRMPGVGRIHPERCHGFGVCALKSMNSFREAGVTVGIGTDGGTGTSFAGAFEVEFISLLRYGYSPGEILRMVTLGNMEIVKMADTLGSITEGKLADMVLVEENPLENIMTMTSPVKVFKEGRCYIDNE